MKILLILAVLVVVLLAIGWIGFMVFDHVPPGEALAATINILSQVGLGAPPTESQAGKIIIGILQAGSVVIVALALGALSQVLLLGTFRQFMGRYRMDERISKLNNHSIIAGYSLTGAALAKDLIAEGEQFVVIERDPETITLLDEMNMLYLEGDATDEEVLKKAGIERAKALFAVLSNDSDNLMVVLSARGLSDTIKIVSRCTREEYTRRFLRAGADAAMSPQEWASRRMVQAVLRPHLLEFLSSLLDPTVAHAYLDEVKVPEGSPVVGKTLADSGIRKASGIAVLGIARSSGECLAVVGADTVIEKGDVLLGYGRRSDFASLAKFVGGG